MKVRWRGLVVLAVGGWFVAGSPLLAQDDQFQGLPEGPGQEDTYHACTACHAIHLVKQQRLSRSTWDGLLELMVEEHGMQELEPDEHALILDYLVAHYGRDVPR
ncbi:MAG: aldehyde dehydrogenase [Pseudomonadota bacterium]